MASRRPQRAGQPDALKGDVGCCLPFGKLAVEDWIQVLLRRIPGFHQVMIECDLVDRFDSGLGIRVGSQQDFTSIRIYLGGIFEELSAAHVRHSLIYQEKRDDAAALAQLTQRRKRFFTGAGFEDAVAFPILAAQVALDSAQNFYLIVEDEDDWFCQDDSFENSDQ
jgi:hypothetical protein